MAIIIPTYSIGMPDADFIKLNDGTVAPTIDPQGVFFNLVAGYPNAVTAVSAAGTTTVSLAAGHSSDGNINYLLTRIRAGAQCLNITITPG